MKNSLVFILILGTLLLYSCQESPEHQQESEAVTQAFDEAKEKEAILSVIEEETKCFFERNYECWKENWIQEDYAFQAWNNADGTFAAAIGWGNIDNQAKGYIENIPEGQTATSHPIVKRENMQFKFYNDNLAYLIWKQYNSDRKNEFYSVSQEIRLMEKKDGAWKIVNVSSFWDAVNKVPFDDLKI